jgi:hypothetical protein
MDPTYESPNRTLADDCFQLLGPPHQMRLRLKEIFFSRGDRAESTFCSSQAGRVGTPCSRRSASDTRVRLQGSCVAYSLSVFRT